MAIEQHQLSTVVPAETLPEAYRRVRAIEDKLRAAYPEARFELHCVADDELQLFIYSNADSIHDPMDLIEGEQDRLSDELGISLFLVPAGPP